MGRHLVTFIFMLLAAAVGKQAVAAVGDAVTAGELDDWLTALYSVLKLAVAVAFTVFVIMRPPARQRARRPVAYITCAAVFVPAVLKAPGEADSALLVISGEAIALVGCAWMLIAALALGRCFGVLPEARGLVTHGPYGLVRHPLYLGEFTAMGGLLLASPSTRNLAAGGLFVVAQLMRMRFEEQALTAEFPEYAEYATRTPRVLPTPGSVLGIVRARFARRLRAVRRPLSAGESGVAVVEYSIILGLVAAVVAAALTPLGTAVNDLIAPVTSGF